MLEWTTSGHGSRFAMIVHHDDAERESHVDKGPQRGWSILCMKDDWKTVFPPDKK